jgi:hypothetical protein
MHAQYGLPPSGVWEVDANVAIEPPHYGGIQDLGPVRRGDHNHVNNLSD